jgi:hypothetical protein
MKKRYCTIPECTGNHIARGYCRTHYDKWQHHGDPTWVKFKKGKPCIYPPNPWKFVNVRGADDCWLWLGAVIGPGYGHLHRSKVGGINEEYAHRFFWTLSNGPIPEGMTIDHLCFNTLCCNPKHLRLLSRSQNSANRREVKNRTGQHRKWRKDPCKHRGTDGEILPEYTYVNKGVRICRGCQSERFSGWQRGKQEEARRAQSIDLQSA